MGYMGFGMRKEVYTRKPVRAFKKVKEYTAGKIVKAKATKIQPVSSLQLEKVRQQVLASNKEDFFRRLVFMGFSVIIGTAIILILINWFIH